MVHFQILSQTSLYTVKDLFRQVYIHFVHKYVMKLKLFVWTRTFAKKYIIYIMLIVFIKKIPKFKNIYFCFDFS